MQSIEEVINIPILLERLKTVVAQHNLDDVIAEIVKHSQVEFNLQR